MCGKIKLVHIQELTGVDMYCYAYIKVEKVLLWILMHKMKNVEFVNLGVKVHEFS